MASHKETVVNLAKRLGVIRPRDLNEYRISHMVLFRLYRQGEMIRIGRGMYRLPDTPITEHHTLAEIGKKVPRGVLCLLSALWFHEIATQSPHEVWVAIDRKARQPKADFLPLRFVTFSGPAMTEGIEIHTIEGVPVRIFNPAKTVADCFKYRNKIGADVAIQALKECLRTSKCSLDDLWKYAVMCRVANVMRPYMEALTI
ncbi:MAG: type IV toxin-antitoxin system AbiEi family antitoxin domain-containing protein [Candidatus Latescibacterota bacterium]